MTEPPTSSTTLRPERKGLFVWLAAAGGIGFSPIAPGTLGSLVGIPLAIGLGHLPSVWWQIGILAMIALLGVPICAMAVRQLGGQEDPGCVVIDEVVGMAATLLFFDPTSVVTLVTAFALFRLFDILKPTPAREVEELPHGWGIMADDLVAALYANLSLRLLLWSAAWLSTARQHRTN